MLVAAAPAAISGLASLFGGTKANKASRKEAERNRQFQERMRNTAWQSGIEDMRAAGLNPALAYGQGPAASPGGSMASQRDVVTPAVSSALQAKRLQADLELVHRQADTVYAQGVKAQREAKYQEMLNKLWGSYERGSFTPGPLWDLHVSQAGSAREQFRAGIMQNQLLQNMAAVADTPSGKALAYIRYLLQSIKGR